MKALKVPKLSFNEYIQLEIDTDQKYEFHDGVVYALAGGSLYHALLIGNIYAELRGELRKKGSNCKPITNDAKLHIVKEDKYVYPDSMVICGDIKKSEVNKDAVTNPILIVEVLSKSTTDYDRGDKFYFYRQIPSLQEYVLIDQYRYVVEVFCKKEKHDSWKIARFEGFDKTIYLQSINVDIKMSDLYFDVSINETKYSVK